jgi:hypothetical protein
VVVAQGKDRQKQRPKGQKAGAWAHAWTGHGRGHGGRAHAVLATRARVVRQGGEAGVHSGMHLRVLQNKGEGGGLGSVQEEAAWCLCEPRDAAHGDCVCAQPNV